MGVEPTMADLQSAALATWLRRHHGCLLYRTQRRRDVTEAGKIGKLYQDSGIIPDARTHGKGPGAPAFPLKISCPVIRCSIPPFHLPFPQTGPTRVLR